MRTLSLHAVDCSTCRDPVIDDCMRGFQLAGMWFILQFESLVFANSAAKLRRYDMALSTTMHMTKWGTDVRF